MTSRDAAPGSSPALPCRAICLAVSVMLIASHVYASSPQSQFLHAVGIEVKAMTGFLYLVSILMGIVFLGLALREFVQHHQHPGDGRSIAKGIAGLIAGTLLVSLPWTIDIVGGTVLQSDDMSDDIFKARPLDNFGKP